MNLADQILDASYKRERASSRERTRKSRAQRKQKGLIGREYWATPEQHEQVKRLLNTPHMSTT